MRTGALARAAFANECVCVFVEQKNNAEKNETKIIKRHFLVIRIQLQIVMIMM